MERGNRIQSVVLVKSTQTLPIVLTDFLMNPRIMTITTTIPVAADRKFWTVKAIIWVK